MTEGTASSTELVEIPTRASVSRGYFGEVISGIQQQETICVRHTSVWNTTTTINCVRYTRYSLRRYFHVNHTKVGYLFDSRPLPHTLHQPQSS